MLVSTDGIDNLQNDVNRMQFLALLWQLSFYIFKCWALHLGMGKTNPNHIYYINSEPLQNINEEKDLGIIIDNQLKFHRHASSVSNKAHQLLALIWQSFIYFDTETFPHLYKSIVWPILEYGNLIWGPFYLLDQQRIERVQRYRLIKEFSHLQYEERFLFLKLSSLYYRRHQEVIWY